MKVLARGLAAAVVLGVLASTQTLAARSYEGIENERATTQDGQLTVFSVPDGGSTVLLLGAAAGALLLGRKVIGKK